jgi:hypothetical protein
MLSTDLEDVTDLPLSHGDNGAEGLTRVNRPTSPLGDSAWRDPRPAAEVTLRISLRSIRMIDPWSSDRTT